jgi:hypothetical protein
MSGLQLLWVGVVDCLLILLGVCAHLEFKEWGDPVYFRFSMAFFGLALASLPLFA